MRFTVTMKTPDALEDAIRERAKTMLYDKRNHYDYNDDVDELTRKTLSICKNWFKYNESVTIIVDTDAMTCEVL